MISDTNSVRLQVVLSAMQSLRYTPAGVAMIDAVLSHRSSQVEAGHARQVEFDLSARFADRQAERLSRTALGSALKVQGFMAARRKGSKALLLHVTEFELDSVSPAGEARH